MKIRIKFTKEGHMKFIGHLDMMRYFQKAFRRSGIDIAYSQGFSPHQLISFASPLGLGLTSTGEYMDIIVHSTGDSKAMIERLNREMVEGVQIISWHLIEDETKNSNAMSILAAADYAVTFKTPALPDALMAERLSGFMEMEQILVEKKTKKSIKTVDIRPLIYEAKCDGPAVFLKLCAGSVNNLKPEVVMETFMRASGYEPDLMSLNICRLEMYARAADGSLVSLDDLGREIFFGTAGAKELSAEAPELSSARAEG